MKIQINEFLYLKKLTFKLQKRFGERVSSNDPFSGIGEVYSSRLVFDSGYYFGILLFRGVPINE